MRFTALFPFACAIAAFVLSMLALFAGSKAGFMEDYDIVRLNTSSLGKNLLNATQTSSAPQTKPTSITTWLTNTIQNITNDIEDTLTAIENNIADKLAAELGIKQWYSFHLTDMCEGNFSPNATTPGAGLNISQCSNMTAMYRFDPTSKINAELESKVHFNLTTLGWTDEIQDGLNALNAAMAATFIIYCIGIAACGLAILTALIAFFLHGSRLISFGNWGLSFLAFLALAVASIIVTISGTKALDIFNKYGNEIGVYAYRGGKFLALTWSATGIMLIASVLWVAEMCVGRRQQRREYTEKPTGGRGWRGRF